MYIYIYHMHIHTYIYIYIYIHTYTCTYMHRYRAVTRTAMVVARLRTNGVSTSGAVAKVTNFDGLVKKVRPGIFGKIKVG